MKEYNIFIVASPLQLLNSIEACSHFKTRNNVLILIKTQDKNNILQMENLLGIFHWDKIISIELPQTNLQRLLFSTTVKNKLQDLIQDHIEKVFVGEFRSDHITHIVNYLNAKKTYLVDDGTAVLFYDIYIKRTFKTTVRAFFYKLFYYKLNIIDFTFFTIFDLKEKQIVKNNYKYIKNIFQEKKYENSVFFIGQPLVELGMINENNYKLQIKKILQSYENKKFIYILHRRQNEKFIKKLSLELGFEYKRLEQLIELEMVLTSTIPSDFATFYSTAIVTLPKLIDNCKFKAFKININNLNQNSPHIKPLIKYYEEFSNSGIEVEAL